MKDLLLEVQASIFMEYERAKEKFGPTNNSPHESYAVILEEFEEAAADAADFQIKLDRFWSQVKRNISVDVRNSMLREMRECAEHAAAEWIQVAAMCYKATVKKEEQK
ncbi:hypothetical protein SAMN02745823_03831 [Sporobacter termitidis DSM 10068]|uniref:Uncharacterized protein n=1 Tax=Sporobacter termitidis DSM 10068 TaxID=1123282 RepID=A0A1M5ZKE5_9FIRM|nr:hypothetical protein [Sporobacter termitidis]SHI24403.1 hypothetical protein SAMN02745823_03831 [Sporobacter termitidis DSM 10068]